MPSIKSRLRSPVLAALLALLALIPSGANAVAVDGAQNWVWPTSGRITQPFGCTGFPAEPRRGSCPHFHMGIDIANDKGTPIVAVADGTVSLVGWDPWIHPDPDWMVIIDHGNGLQTMYAHMTAKPFEGITKGAHVSQGQQLGLMDMTGRATGPHLHFAVYLNGVAINPRLYLTGPVPAGAGTAGPQDNGCANPDEINGVGAGLDGRTAMVPPGEPLNVCSA